jgi:demethylmenaquinone methyltransferase/2-methoxy-6-polyprenyl-1,4-benzoquinol methylase
LKVERWKVERWKVESSSECNARQSVSNPKTEGQRPKPPPIGEIEGKGQAIEAMFDRIAPRYDLLNRVLSFGVDQWWRRRAVAALREALGNRPPARILDAATGTADLAIRAAQTFDGAEVVGVDLAEEMLRRGRRKVRRRGLAGRVELERGDATALSFSGDVFDGALVAFGVRNYEDLGAGLRELHRVLAPGAALVVLEFSRPRTPGVRQLYDLYARHVLPRIGRLVSGDAEAYRYLPASAEVFPDGAAFLRRLRAAGFRSTRWCPLFPFGIASLYVGTVSG